MTVADLIGRRVLLVEDEFLVALTLEEALRDAGCVVLGPIPRVEKAVPVAREEAIDVALLDVNLAGEKVYPVAQALSERDVPFIFMTGYERVGLPATYADRPAISKPFMIDAMLDLLKDVLDHAHGAVG
jgi:DNA-binding NtrC family response regulator